MVFNNFWAGDFLPDFISNLLHVVSQGVYGCTPLHIATINNNKGVVEMLLKKNANPLLEINFKGSKGVTPLDIATLNHNEEIVQLLLGYVLKFQIVSKS